MTTIEAEEEALSRGQWVVGADGEVLPFLLIEKEWQDFVALQERRSRIFVRWIHEAKLCGEEACAGLGSTARILRQARFQIIDEQLTEARLAWEKAWSALEAATRLHEGSHQLHSRIFDRHARGRISGWLHRVIHALR